MTKPTRIIEKPFMQYVQGYRYKMMVCRCDNGITYTMGGLAELIGIRYQSLVQRIRIYGYDSDFILQGKAVPGCRIDGQKFDRLADGSGNKAWRRLDCRPRNRRLEKIPPPGIFERRL